MGREVRRVPADWVHPVVNGNPVPLHDGFTKALCEWLDGSAKWADGLMPEYATPSGCNCLACSSTIAIEVL